MVLADGPIADFDAWFDPTGTRLALWVADPVDPSVGTLRLVVLDPETLQVDTTTDPLPGVAALRGVSISNGRLAWVTPPGQDGQGSHVQVLAWKAASSGRSGRSREIDSSSLAEKRQTQRSARATETDRTFLS